VKIICENNYFLRVPTDEENITKTITTAKWDKSYKKHFLNLQNLGNETNISYLLKNYQFF